MTHPRTTRTTQGKRRNNSPVEIAENFLEFQLDKGPTCADQQIPRTHNRYDPVESSGGHCCCAFVETCTNKGHCCEVGAQIAIGRPYSTIRPIGNSWNSDVHLLIIGSSEEYCHICGYSAHIRAWKVSR